MGSRSKEPWFLASGKDTVIAPEALRDVFETAQENVRRYFTAFDADPARGCIEIGDDRYVLVRASALSTDFLDSIAQLYHDRELSEAQAIGRAFLFDIAHTIGKNDARSFHLRMGLTDPIERLSTGPVHFSYSGWALVEIKPESRPSLDDDFVLNYDHPYSFEADTWLRAGRSSHGPVCIMGAGYSSGWCEESFGFPLTAVELECKARGDEACSFIMAPPHRIEQQIRAARPDIASFNIPRYFERKTEEDALRRSERRLNSILTATPLPVLITGEDGTLLYTNAHAKDVFDVAPGRGDLGSVGMFDDAAAAGELLGAIAKGERVDGREYVMRRADDEPFVALVSCHPLLLPDGERGIVLTALDVTNYKRAEAALRMNERMATVGTLATGVAHEINNPLAYVIGNLERARMLLADREQVDEVLASIDGALEGATRVRKIVRDLKTLAKAPVDDGNERVNVSEVLERTIAMASVEWKHRARIVRDYGTVGPVRGLSGRIGQVFLNLLVNAAHAIEEGAAPVNEIRLRTRQRGGRVEVTIEDTGVGIAAAVLRRVFDPFFTTRGVGGGTGLGLSISRSIIATMGGEIEIESTPGQGTQVIVALPLASESEPEARPPPEAAVELDGVSILVVDDEPRLTELFGDMLADASVTCASSGREALAELAAGPFDVVLCDLMMPDITGMELYRSAPERLQKLFIFMTGGAFTPTAASFVRSVSNPCLEKPVELAELRAAIRSHLVGLASPGHPDSP